MLTYIQSVKNDCNDDCDNVEFSSHGRAQRSSPGLKSSLNLTVKTPQLIRTGTRETHGFGEPLEEGGGAGRGQVDGGVCIAVHLERQKRERKPDLKPFISLCA